MSLDSRSQTVSDEFQTIQNVCWENGWTDGLPVVPPTESAVRKMLSSVPDDPSTVLGRMDPSNAQVPLEKLAINAVMAGCLPEYFPVVIASVKETLDKDFVKMERAIGIPESLVIGKYVLRTVFVATLTVISLEFGWLMAGAVLVETIFDWPGLGLYIVESSLRLES